jgi:hypothetical protein
MVFNQVALEDGARPVVEDETAEAADNAGDDDFDAIFGDGEAAKARAEPSKKIKLSREEAIVYKQVDGKATVQDIIDRTLLSEFETCRALFDLYSRNLIGPVARESTVSRPGERPKRVEVGSYLVRALYPLLAVAVLMGIALQARNPLNTLTRDAASIPVAEQLKQDEAYARLERLATAVDAYILDRVEYPTSAEDLVGAGLVREEHLLDPWGRPLGYELGADAIVMSVRLGAGEDAPLYRLTRPF